jgi:hypothetical protein
MDVTKTRRQLIDQVLGNMQVLAPGQTPADEDVQRVDGVIDAVVVMLSALDVYYVDDAGQPGPLNGAIDAAAFLPLAHCVAKEAGAAFGLGADPALVALDREAKAELRTIGRPAGTKRLLTVDRALTLPRRGVFNFTTGQ